MRIFCTAKDYHFFNKELQHICDIYMYFQNFNQMFTNDMVNFEPPGPGTHVRWLVPGPNVR